MIGFSVWCVVCGEFEVTMDCLKSRECPGTDWLFILWQATKPNKCAFRIILSCVP